MIMGANGLFFVTMTVLGRNYYTFDIAMFVISAISFIGCFQFMRWVSIGTWNIDFPSKSLMSLHIVP